MGPRILIAEPVHAALDPLGHAVRVELEPELWNDRPALLKRLEGCAALVVRNQTRVDGELLTAASELRVVGRLGAGLDNLDLEALGQRHVVVVHGGGLNAQAVSEYVFGAIVDLSRGLAHADREVRSGVWPRRVGMELAGRTLGVVGLGRTGVRVARLGQAFGMVVLGHDPFASQPVPGVLAMPLHDLLRRADVVSLHVPLTYETRHLIGGLEIALMPAGALLVNAARGGVVDESALFAALETHRLGGAALDVREVEPPAPDDRFGRLPNVLLTPHLAGLTRESQAAIAESVLGDVRRVLEGRAPTGPCILPA